MFFGQFLVWESVHARGRGSCWCNFSACVGETRFCDVVAKATASLCGHFCFVEEGKVLWIILPCEDLSLVRAALASRCAGKDFSMTF